MDAPQAVLLVAHYVVSLFGIQLGNGVMKSYPFPTMEICEVYKGRMNSESTLDMEYRLITRTDCVTMKKYIEITEKNLEKKNDE